MERKTLKRKIEIAAQFVKRGDSIAKAARDMGLEYLVLWRYFKWVKFNEKYSQPGYKGKIVDAADRAIGN